MKTIGRTNDGNYLVEMNEVEHKLFANLSEVAEGSLGNFNSKNFIRGDFEKTLNAINWWMENQFNINRIKATIEELERAIGKHE